MNFFLRLFVVCNPKEQQSDFFVLCIFNIITFPPPPVMQKRNSKMVQQHRDEDERKNAVGIIYVRGDATLPQGKGVKIVAHVCNTIGGWGKGFVRAVSARFGREPEKAYRLWYKKKKNKRTFYTILFFLLFFHDCNIHPHK